MALLPWNEDEEQKDESLFSTPQRTAIKSVQSSAWQPASQSASTQLEPTNYLVSDEKAQYDEAQRQRQAQEEAARQAALAQADAARRAQAAQQIAKQQATPVKQVAKAPVYKPANIGEDVGNFFEGIGKGLWKGAAGVLGSGASLISSAVTGKADNAVTKATQDWQKSADDWGNQVHANGIGEFVGALPGNVVSGVTDLGAYYARGARNTPEMIAASIAAGSSDKFTRQAGIEEQKRLQDNLFGKEVTKQGDLGMALESVAQPADAILNVLTGGNASVVKNVGEGAFKQVAKEFGKQGLINAATGVPISVAEQVARGEEITPGSVVGDTLIQGLTGGVIGAGAKARALSKAGGITPIIDDGNISFESKTVTPEIDNTRITPPPVEPQIDTPITGVITPMSQTPTPIVKPEIAIPKADDAPVLADNVPEGMSGNVTPVKTNTPPTMKDLADRTVTGSSKPEELKSKVARAVGLEQDAGLPIEDIVAGSKLKDSHKKELIKKFNELDKLVIDQNDIQRKNRELVGSDQLDSLSPEQSKKWSSLERRKGELSRDISNLARFADSKKSFGNKAAYVLENVVSGKNANQLLGAPGVVRNTVQDSLATIESAIKAPIRTMRSIPNGGNPLKSAIKSSVGGFKSTPKSISEAYKHAVGNVYGALMVPASTAAKMRDQPIREALAEMGLRATGKKPTRSEVVNYSRALDGDAEAVVNVLSGVANSMTNRSQANKAIKAYQKLVETGEPAYREQLQKLAEKQTTLAQKLVSSLDAEGTPAQRIKAALAEALLPYIRVAGNTAINGAYRLIPSKTVIDQVLSSVKSKPENFLNIIKNTAPNYAIVGTIAAMVNAGVIAYSDGEDDRPRGVSIKVGKDTYIPIRATNAETEIAATLAAVKIAKGEATLGEATKMLSDSVPYVSSTENIATAAKSSLEASSGNDNSEGDGGYAAKSYALNQAKSLIPASNNGLLPFVNSIKGKSTNAKSTYNKDMGNWFTNQLKNAYNVDRESLKDSRDNAGRVRTMDNQGLFINKTINDENTATYNDSINSLVKYSKDNKLGEGVKDIFNTYDTGKNNNFKSALDTITYLDVEEVNGKKTPDNAKKLESNEKLGALAQQIKNGFYGDTGSELLTLDGKNIKSDASTPGKYGGDNAKLPLSMESIKNAIAQTGLPADQQAQLYAIGQQKDDLYARRKAGEITYEQEKAMRYEIGNQEEALLQKSEGYKKLNSLMDKLTETGFFEAGGLGSTKSGQTYLWNSLNILLGSKGATPAANYPETAKSGSGSGGKGNSLTTPNPGDRGFFGIKWTPVTARQMAKTSTGKYTPLKVKVTLGNEIKKNRTQNYADRSF